MCSLSGPERPPLDLIFLLVPTCPAGHPHSPVTDQERRSESLLRGESTWVLVLALSLCDLGLRMKNKGIGPDGFI